MFTLPVILGLLIILLVCIKGSASEIVVAIVVVTFISLWCIAYGQMALKIATNKLIIRNNKLVITYYSGLTKIHVEILFDKLAEITVAQNILSKSLNCGTLSIQTISGSKNAIVGLNAPSDIKAGIQNYR